MGINNKVFEHRPIEELLSMVKNDMKKFDAEGLIDDGTLIKTVMYCNEKLGITIREVREAAIPVNDFKAKLPLDFEKLFYVCALEASNTMTTVGRNPFDNNVDQDVIYEAQLDRQSLGCTDNYMVTINRQNVQKQYNYNSWVQLDINNSKQYCHIDCPNIKKPGKYSIIIKDGYIETPFRAGTLYIMYIGMMKDNEGRITFPFHPMITPFYEWTIKEKILTDAVFNSDITNIGDMLKFAQVERSKAWIDAFNFSTEKDYGDLISMQRKKELGWYNQYFKYLQ